MLLSDLPTDVLALILVGEVSSFAVELWMCGNWALCTKLENRGVVALELSDYKPIEFVRKLPRCISFFKLDSLVIWPEAQPLLPLPASFLNKTLSSLYSGLKSFRIASNSAVEAIFGISKMSSYGSYTRFLPDSPSYPTDPEFLCKTYTIDFEAQFPHLESLTIISDFTYFNDSHLHRLPRNLTYLALTAATDHMTPQQPWKDLSGIPLKKLTYLRLPFGVIGEANIEQLRSDVLTTIDTICLSRWMQLWLVKEAQYLFPNLTSLRLPNPIEFSHLEQMEELGIIKWPAVADEMHFNGCTMKTICSKLPFPSALSKLCITSVPASTTPFDETKFFNAIGAPIALRMLELEKIDWNLIPNASVWPKTIEKLGIYLKPTPFSAFAKLPRRLKQLQLLISYVGVVDESVWDHLRLKAKKALEETDLEIWNSIMKHHAIEEEKKSGKFSKANLSALSNGKGLALPLLLESLVVDVLDKPSFALSCIALPPYTTTLDFRVDALLPFFQELPPSVTNLSLEPLRTRSWAISEFETLGGFELGEKTKKSFKNGLNLTTEGDFSVKNNGRDEIKISEEPVQCNDPNHPQTPQYELRESIFTQERFNLVTLTLRETGFGTYYFPILPRTLRNLNLHNSLNDFGNHILPAMAHNIALLPPKLENLYAPSLVAVPDNKWTSNLPRSLTSFHSNNAIVYGSDILHLPPSLTCFSVRTGVDISIAHLRSSPSKLLLTNIKTSIQPEKHGESSTSSMQTTQAQTFLEPENLYALTTLYKRYSRSHLAYWSEERLKNYFDQMIAMKTPLRSWKK